MPKALQYIVDESGIKSSVLVPLKVWEDLNTNYQKLKQKVEILNGISEGLNEVQQAKKTGRKLQTLKDFLNDSNGSNC
ncbi:MAG: hypothetical protein JWQ09_3420 [Segetibacter sp.]|nr:hypothetical protein [Segetibacter sp.]